MSKNNSLKLGFLFGAGAEKSFGLPDGGEFALSLFKYNYNNIKAEFNNALTAIKEDTNRAYYNWLSIPKNRQIRSFSKQDFQIVLESTAEQKKAAIIEYLNNIDDHAINIYKKLPQNLELSTKANSPSVNPALEQWYKTLRETLTPEKLELNLHISLNQQFQTQANDLSKFLSSKTFAVLLTTLRLPYYEDSCALAKDKQQPVDNAIPKSIYLRLNEACKVILYMALLACGDDILKALNSCFFTSDNEQDQVLCDVCALFTMDNSDAAEQIFNFIVQEPIDMPVNEDEKKTISALELLNIIVYKLSYQLCAQSMDYQKLIDNYFRYIMTPKTDWAKFTKIFLFLRAAYDAIMATEIPEDKLSASESGSYYHDIVSKLKQEPAPFVLVALGSSNYRDLYQEIVARNVANQDAKYLKRFGKLTRLNGGVDEFYNPYKNSLVSKEKVNKFLCQDTNQLVAPFFFTQSGIKPITAIEVSCRYAELYQNYKTADAIVAIGFNFNADDSHINTIFRDLVENHNKHLICTSIKEPIEVNSENKSTIKFSKEEQEQELCDKLRIDDTKARARVHVIILDKETRKLKLENKPLWLDYIINSLKQHH